MERNNLVDKFGRLHLKSEMGVVNKLSYHYHAFVLFLIVLCKGKRTDQIYSRHKVKI